MFVKKFEGSTLEDVIRQVRIELGNDALILSTQQKNLGLLRKTVFEATVAYDQNKKIKTTKKVEDSKLQKFDSYHRTWKIQPTDNELFQPVKRESTRSNSAQNSGFYFGIEKSFMRSGISQEASKELAIKIVFDYPRKDLNKPEYLSKIKIDLLSQNIEVLDVEKLKEHSSWVLIGPSGSGKTAAIVKLATVLTAKGEKVEMVSRDLRKIMGQSELYTFARLLGLPFKRNYETSNHLALIDTCAWSQTENAELEVLCKDHQPILVLDLTMRLIELMNTVEKMMVYHPKAIYFSRADYSLQRGIIFDVLKKTRLPLLAVSESISFENTLRFFSKESLAQYILGDS